MNKIIRSLFAVAILMVMVLPLVIPADVSAANPDKNKVTIYAGDKVVLSNSLEAEFTGNYDAVNGKPIWKSTISAPIYSGDFTKKQSITPYWSFDGSKYSISPNTFTAEYSGGTVKINNGETQWTPDIALIGSKIIATKLVNAPAIINDYINPLYSNNILRLTYIADNGMSFTRDLRVIEGELIEYYTFTTNPNADIMIRENIKGDKTHMQHSTAWDSNKKSIAIDVINDTKIVSRIDLAKATYPVVLDPTNTYYTSASDGYTGYGGSSTYSTVHDADGSAASYNSSGNVLEIGQLDAFTGPDSYWLYRSYVYFDTSALPDTANITAATLSLYGNYDSSSQDFNMVVSNGQPNYPHDPLIGNDYYYADYSGNGGQLTTGGFSTVGYNAITLTSTGIGWISTTGTTKFAILSSRDISSTPPAYGTPEYVWVYAYEQGVGYRPKLDITYSATLPTVSTASTSTIACTSATLAGSLDNLGGDVVTDRGFVYGTTSNTTKPSATQAPPAGYTANTTENSTTGFTTGAFYGSISGLTKGTPYYYRAYAYNSQGWGYGDQYNFTTWNNPAIATATATSVTSTTARLQSVMSSGGGTTCQVIWGWGTVNQGTNIEAYQHYLGSWTGSYSTGDNPYYDITGLNASTTYFFNVKATNTCGNTTATSGTFATGTGISAPTNVVAQPTSNSTIALSWSMVSTTPQVNIRYGINFAPTSNITGTFLYRGNASNYLHQGLTQGSTYYYWIQGYDNTIGYSADNVTVSATVLSVVAGDSNFVAPVTPPSMLATPTGASFEQWNPVAPLLNKCYDAVGLPRGIGWFILSLIISIGFGMGAYAIQGDGATMVLVISVSMGLASVTGAVPVAAGIVFAIIALGIVFAKVRAI
jgi:hypothetical protein